MKNYIGFTLALVLATPGIAQSLEGTSTSGSDATSISGSQSGAASDQAQGQSQSALVGVSENVNTSTSASGSVSGSESRSGSVSDQAQTSANANTNSATLGQQAVNQQGVTVVTNNLSTNRKTTEVRTNNAVPLAASSSFSSDFCSSTASGGVSSAPLGISIGGAGPVIDRNCQALRRAEKAGMLAANYANMGQPEMAMKAMSLMTWALCTSDSQGPRGDAPMAQACLALGLLGQGAMEPSAKSIPSPGAAPEPKTVARRGGPTPEAVQKVADDARSQKVALTAIGH